MDLSASSVADLSLEELRSAKSQPLFGSAEKVHARGTFLKFPERQLLFDSPRLGSSINRRVTHSGDVDGEKVFPHYEVQLRWSLAYLCLKLIIFVLVQTCIINKLF